MKNLVYAIVSGLIAYVFMLVIVPIFRKVALKLNLTDKPNSRKLHLEPVPLVGGLSIAAAVLVTGLLSYANFPLSKPQVVIVLSSLVLLIVGVIDDRYDLPARYKLLIQVFCALVIAGSGTRITSVYGLFGVYEIPVVVQYSITIITICGVVNAFNLMDGIDGLAGQLSIIGFSCLGVFAFLIQDYRLAMLCVTFLGAILGFLRFNLTAQKIFMGDAGSLFIGNILIGFSIFLLKNNSNILFGTPVLLYVIVGFFALPVLDSLRVYLGRMKKGQSPFQADKTHLHHLLLVMNLSHKTISLMISVFTLFILFFGLLVNYYTSLTVSLVVVILLYSLLGFLLNQNRKLHEWTRRIKDIEKRG